MWTALAAGTTCIGLGEADFLPDGLAQSTSQAGRPQASLAYRERTQWGAIPSCGDKELR